MRCNITMYIIIHYKANKIKINLINFYLKI